MSSSKGEFNIDGVFVDKRLIEGHIKSSKSASYSDTISEVFRLCEDLNQYQQNPLSKELKSSIKGNIDNKFSKQPMASRGHLLDLEKVYPLNKPGNFGRVLERRCRLVERGVLEFEEGREKDAKIKEIKSFVNRVEIANTSDVSDLDWLPDAISYKFRVVLLDNNQNRKGIYCETLEEANRVRIYLSWKYKPRKIDSKVLQSLSHNLNSVYFDEFAAIVRNFGHEKIRIANSKKSKPRNDGPNSSEQSEVLVNVSREAEDSSSVFKSRYSPESLKSRPVQGKGFLDDILSKTFRNQNQNDGSMKPERTPFEEELEFALIDLEKTYKKNMFEVWISSANRRLKRSNHKVTVSQPKRDQSLESESNFPSLGNHSLQTRNRPIVGHNTTLSNSNFSSVSNNRLMPLANSFSKEEENGRARIINLDENIDSPHRESRFVQENSSRSPSILNESPLNSPSRLKHFSHSRKQESILPFMHKITEESERMVGEEFTKRVGNERLTFCAIEFLNPKEWQPENRLFFKPIVSISVHKSKKYGNSALSNSYRARSTAEEYDCVFNTIAKNVSGSHYEYDLSPVEESGSVFETESNAHSFCMEVSVLNFLSNQEVLRSEINLREFEFRPTQNRIIDEKRSMKLKFEYKNSGVLNPNPRAQKYCPESLHLHFPPIDPEIIEKIKNYWETEATSKSYYNLEDNFNLFDAVSNSSNEAEPQSWWVDLDEVEYNYLCILQSSSKVLGYKLVRPMLHLIRAVRALHFKIETLIELLLSTILNFGKFYYFTPELTAANHLHRQLGLTASRIEFQDRVLLETMLFNQVLALECPSLLKRLTQLNICLSHLMMEYTYELFSQNFEIECLLEVWRFCNQEQHKIPLYFFLLSVVLCKHHEGQLLKCKRLRGARQIFETKAAISSAVVVRQLSELEEKYFYKGKNLIDEIKQAFRDKPLEGFLSVYQRKVEEHLKNVKNSKEALKRGLCQKYIDHSINESSVRIAKPERKKYTLHLYFYKVPDIAGKLVMVTEEKEYESISSEKYRYLIIGEVSSSVWVKFTDFKGNVYTGEMVFNQGFNEFKIWITCERTQLQFEIHYLSGLLTDSQIEAIKGNRRYSHFIGPNIERQNYEEEMLLPMSELRFSNIEHDSRSEEWVKNLKLAFSYGSKSFNEIQFFLFQLATRKVCFEEKVDQLRTFCSELSRENCLCDNRILFKQLLHEFVRISFPCVRPHEFECYFNDSLTDEFDAPKIIKCRFICNQKELKLEKEAISFHSKRSYEHLYGDLDFDELIKALAPAIKQKMGSVTDGELRLMYSTFGAIEVSSIPIKVSDKELTFDQERALETSSIFHEISHKTPEVLMTEVLPSFSKISTILDYVNSNRPIDLKSKVKAEERRVIPESLNLLKFVQNKFKHCIFLRYKSYPTHICLPFYSYFEELSSDVEGPKVGAVFLNNVKESMKAVCTCKSMLRFSSNHKEQELTFDKALGLHGNLRKLLSSGKKVNTVFFWTFTKDEAPFPQSLVYVDYGYGISRWESCVIRKYRKRVKQRADRRESSSASKQKIQYLVEYKGKQFFCRDYEVQLNPRCKDMLELCDSNYGDLGDLPIAEIKQGLSFLFKMHKAS